MVITSFFCAGAMLQYVARALRPARLSPRFSLLADSPSAFGRFLLRVSPATLNAFSEHDGAIMEEFCTP